jgi:hypothetical protein
MFLALAVFDGSFGFRTEGDFYNIVVGRIDRAPDDVAKKIRHVQNFFEMKRAM